jgi:type I restriction enzyme S subunit
MKWPIKKLGDVLKISRGGSPRPIENYLTEDVNGLNWIKIGDVEVGAKYITQTKERIKKEGLKKTRKVYVGDFLLSNSMSFGRPYITKIDGCIHDGWLTLKDESKIFDTNFLYHVLGSNAVKEQFQKYASGAVVKNLNVDAVSKVVIAIPPLSEQQRIAALLDTADRILKMRELAIAKLDQLAQSVFFDMFGDSLANTKKWPVKKISDITISKPNNGIFRKNPDYGDGFPVAWVEDLFRGDFLDLANARKLEPTISEKFKYSLNYGDLLFCRSSLKLDGIGYSNVYLGDDGKALFECHIIRIKPNLNLVNPIFCNFMLRTPASRLNIKKNSKTVTMTTIDQDGILRSEIILPPLILQKEFARKFQEISLLKSKFSSICNIDKKLIASLQHQSFAVN